MEVLENRACDFCAALYRFSYMPESTPHSIEAKIDHDRHLWLDLCNSKCGRAAFVDLAARWTTTGKSAWLFNLLTDGDDHRGCGPHNAPCILLGWERMQGAISFRGRRQASTGRTKQVTGIPFWKGVRWDSSEQAWWTQEERLLTEEEDG
jgi:hypothetical protein